MLPVVRGERETTRQIVLYSLVLVAFTLVVGLWFGPVYVAAAVRARRRLPLARLAAPARADAAAAPALLFHYSLAYLALLFVAAAVEPGAALRWI